MFQRATPMNGGEKPRDPLMVDGETPGNPPVGIWSWVICLLEDWTPPQNWREVGMPEAVEFALHKIGEYLWELGVHAVVGTVGYKV